MPTGYGQTISLGHWLSAAKLKMPEAGIKELGMDRIALLSLKGPEHLFKSGNHGNGWAGGGKSGSGGARPGHPLPAWSRAIPTSAVVFLLLNVMVNGVIGSAFAGEREEPDEVFHDRFESIVYPPHVTGILNDTGIDWCADSETNFLDCPLPGYSGQDGDHGRDKLAREGELEKVGEGAAGFDYTKLDASGNDLPYSAIAWTCVRDNHTGLIWEAKVNNPDHLRYNGHSYSWYNPDPDSNGGNPGSEGPPFCAETQCDTYHYVQAVNTQSLCGASDWRMPTRMDLNSLVHHGRTDPAIDVTFFPNTSALKYWSATPSAGSPNSAWVVSFLDGSDNTNSKGSAPRRVRLVRNDQ